MIFFVKNTRFTQIKTLLSIISLSTIYVSNLLLIHHLIVFLTVIIQLII